MGKFIDLTGQRFGRLTVVKKGNVHIYPSGKPRIKWVCQCDCGNIVEVKSNDLKSGNTKSCGCYNIDRVIATKTKHGETDTRLYHIWQAMKDRCYNQNNAFYSHYGARGIKVCDEWLGLNGSTNFINWSKENNYKSDRTIDRIDNNGWYTPSNCRWTTIDVQANNKRNSRYVLFDGKKKTVAQWAKEYGLSYAKLYDRLFYLHWDIEKALNTP